MAGFAAGKFNRLLEFYLAPKVKDSNGQMVPGTPALDFKGWGSVTAIRGREQTKYGREEMAMMLMVFKVRFNKKISTEHLIKFNGIFFDIQSLSPFGRRNWEYLEITAQQLNIQKIAMP